jgi:hypothetical protein
LKEGEMGASHMGVLAAAMVMASGDEIALESSGVGGGGGGWWRLHRVTEIRSEERLPVIGRSGEEKESRFAMPCGGWKGIFVHFYLEGEAYQAALSRGFVVTTAAKHFFGCMHKFRILDKFEDGFLCFLICVCVRALYAMYDLCVWHRLTARFMRIGSWKGFIASPHLIALKT